MYLTWLGSQQNAGSSSEKILDFADKGRPIMPFRLAPATGLPKEPGAVGERPASTLRSRWCSVMTALFIAWIALTVVLVVLLIYRGTLTMHEDDQLFLDTAEDHMQKEQTELLGKMDRLTPWVRLCG